MHQYTCPSCNAVLKREAPVPAGKKIRCPKCESVLMRVVESPDRTWIDFSGLRTLEIRR